MWTPREIRKLVALIGGFLLMIVGIILAIGKFTASGVIDVAAGTTVQAKIESVSAGLFICFFSLFIIILAALSKRGSSSTEVIKPPVEKEAELMRLAPYQKGLMIVTIIAWFIAANFVVAGLAISCPTLAYGYLIGGLLWLVCFGLPVTIIFFVSWSGVLRKYKNE